MHPYLTGNHAGNDQGPILGCQAYSWKLSWFRWPTQVRSKNIESYDGTTDPEVFLQIYMAAINMAVRDEKVMENYLLTTLRGSARLWLTNMPQCSIYSWEHLCTLFLGNFQGTYVRPGKEEDLFRLLQ